MLLALRGGGVSNFQKKVTLHSNGALVVGPFYKVSMLGEVKDPIQGVHV